MMQMTKAFYLKIIEFKILLALKGMRELFGFKLDDEVGIDQGQINQILFGMYKKKIVSSRNGKMVLNPELHDLLENICTAGQILILSDREGIYPEQCVYLSNKAVSLQMVGQNKKIVRLEGIELDILPKWLMEAGGKLDQIVSDERLYRQLPLDMPELQYLAKRLWEKDKMAVFEEKGIQISFEVFSNLTRKRICRIFLYTGEIQDYIIVSNGLQNVAYLYSAKKLQQILVQHTGGENK